MPVPAADEQRRRPRLLVLAVHPSKVAATRLRAVQYRPAFQARGFDVELWSLFSPEDLVHWYGRRQWARALVLLAAFRRLPGALRAIRRSDLVLVQREALPFGPPLLELFAARRIPLIWDVDDAVWAEYVSPTAGKVPRWVRASGRKFERLCAAAVEVWAGSEVLAGWCRRHNASVTVVPTVIDVPAEACDDPPGRTVAWIGSHSTGPFLEMVLPALGRVSPPPEVIVVGAEPRAIPPGLPVRVLEWSPQVEHQVLRAARVGLYPIDRSHPLAEGKCGLKAILYMAYGVPSVVTPTTTNAEVVRNEREGLHADNDDQWIAAVQRLLDDQELWAVLRSAGRERALAEYSLQTWGPILADRAWGLAKVAH